MFSLCLLRVLVLSSVVSARPGRGAIVLGLHSHVHVSLHSALSSCTHERESRHAEAGRILVQELHDVPEAVQAALHALSIAEAQSCTKLCQATVRTSILGPQLSTYLISESHVPNLRLFTCLRMMAEGGQGKKKGQTKRYIWRSSQIGSKLGQSTRVLSRNDLCLENPDSFRAHMRTPSRTFVGALLKQKPIIAQAMSSSMARKARCVTVRAWPSRTFAEFLRIFAETEHVFHKRFAFGRYLHQNTGGQMHLTACNEG